MKRMYFIFLTVFFFASCTSMGRGGNGESIFHAMVIDENNNSVQGFSIIKNGKEIARTGENGFFELEWKKIKPIYLEGQKDGWENILISEEKIEYTSLYVYKTRSAQFLYKKIEDLMERNMFSDALYFMANISLSQKEEQRLALYRSICAYRLGDYNRAKEYALCLRDVQADALEKFFLRLEAE